MKSKLSQAVSVFSYQHQIYYKAEQELYQNPIIKTGSYATSVILNQLRVLFRLLNNSSAGQPISLCLQYLQVRLPRINPFPAVVRTIKVTVANSRIKSNSIIIKTMPIIRGTREIKRSGLTLSM